MSNERRSPILHLDILIYPQDGFWVGHCLQLDLLTATNSPEQAFADAQKVCITQIEFAMENNRLDGLFRPQNPELYGMLLRAEEESAELIVQCVRTNLKEHHLEIQGVRTAAPQYARAA